MENIMVFDEADYYTRRALAQLGQAADADDDDVARVHAKLSDMYLERAREMVTLSADAPRTNNVVTLRAVA